MNPHNPWKVLQIVYEPVLESLDSHFQKMAVTYMPVKGAFLIASGLSSNFINRRMRDIDILVRKEDFDRVVQYFGTLKETELLSGYWDFEQPFTYKFLNKMFYVEIHHLVNAPARFLLSTQDLFNRSIVQNSHCVFPNPVDAMLIHVCHHLLHIYDRFDKSFFDEIEVLEKQKDFLWEQFWNNAQNTGIKPFVWLMIKMYSKISERELIIPNWGTWYTSIINRFSFDWLSGLNPAVRKLLLEIPFVRKPFWLLRHKYLNMFRNFGLKNYLWR